MNIGLGGPPTLAVINNGHPSAIATNGMASAGYLARLNAPTPWSQRIMPILGSFRRGGGSVVARQGLGAGGVVAPVLIQRPDEAAAARLGEIVGCDRIVAATLLQVDGAGTGIGTS